MTELNKKSTNTEGEELLSEKEVWDVLEFARNMSPYNNYFTPDLINSRMKDVNLNPLVPNQDKIDSALANPKTSEEELIGYGQYFELIDMIYKRSLFYMGNMLSFDLTYTPINAKVEDLKITSYKKDVERVEEFLQKFNYKQEFTRMTRQMLREETVFTILRDEGSKYTLQELPHKYCKLTGRWDYGFLFDFDMYWFVQPSVDINMYPSVFKEMYNEWYSNDNKYTPSNAVGRRDSNFMYWVQTDPTRNFWAWKFNPDITTNVPYFAPMFADVSLRPIIRELQKNVYILMAQKIIVGLVPLLKDNKSGNVKDMLAVSPETMGKFLGLMKQGLDDAIKVTAAPFEDVKTLDFNSTDKNILESYSQVLASTGASGGRVIYSSDKQTAVESELSNDVDTYIMTYIYPYFEDFLEYHINKLTKKYKFSFALEGTKFARSRKERLDTAMSLADHGIVLPQKIAAAMGMTSKALEMQIEMALASGIIDKLKPLLTSYTSASKDVETQKKDNDDLTDSGSATRESLG